MTDDSLQRVIDEMRSRAETADMVLGRVGQYELKAFSDRLTALSAQTEARDGEVLTYTNQPDNGGAWRLGEACTNAAADPKCGDLIDRGLILLLKLHEKGYGIVSVPKRIKPNE